ncbi:MAG: four helix bundle protein [Prevotella sp.]|nr:four helix bundle protein [Prevotella sp.]
MADNNIVAEKSIDFAIRIVKCYKYLREKKKEDVISKQMLRSGTSIGANIHEGTQAQSPADFISKMSIALKEATETSYWLTILSRTKFLEDDAYDSMKSDLDEIIRILISSIKTTKKNWT